MISKIFGFTCSFSGIEQKVHDCTIQREGPVGCSLHVKSWFFEKDDLCKILASLTGIRSQAEG